MKTKEEIEKELKKRKEQIMDCFLDKSFSGFGGVSLSRKKDIINTLRWVLEEVKSIEFKGRGSGKLSTIKCFKND